MEIVITLEDTWGYQLTGIRSPYKRAIHIQLTPEQLQQLEKRKVGSSGGVDVYEEITGIYINDFF